MWFKASGLSLMMSLCRKFLHASHPCSFITQNKQPWILHYTSSQSQYDQCTWYEPMLFHVLQPHHCLPAFHVQPVCTQCSICFGTRLCWTRPDYCSKERWVCDGGCSRMLLNPAADCWQSHGIMRYPHLVLCAAVLLSVCRLPSLLPMHGLS